MNLRNALVGGAVAIALVGSIAPLSVTSVAAAEAVASGAATVTPTSGTKSTAFQLNLGANPSCPGDSASGGYLWQTYLVPAGTDPALLTFGSTGPISPDGGLASPLFDIFGEPVVDKLTAQASPGNPGGIFGIPQFNLNVFSNEDLPTGNYTVGVACTRGVGGPVQTSTTWAANLRVVSSPSGPTWSTTNPVDNGAATLPTATSGDSSTTFTLGLGTNPSCPGDSATAQYRWHTFMVPASTDLSTLTITAGGDPVVADDGFASPLFSTLGDPVSNVLTDPAVDGSPVGGISGIPTLNFAQFGPGDLPAGNYKIGVACTVGLPGISQVKSYWSTTIRVVTLATGGGPARVAWSTTGAPTDNGSATASVAAGNSATEFALSLGTNPSCPGDSEAGYRWHTFMVPAATELSTLTFTAGGEPIPVADQFRSPLFNFFGDPVSNVLTDPAVGGNPAGGISGIPTMNFAQFGPQQVPAGLYKIGVACTVGLPAVSQVKSYWSTVISVVDNPGGSDPAQLTWKGVPRAPVSLAASAPAAGTLALSWAQGHTSSATATTSYLVTTSAGIRACSTTSATTCTVTGLPTTQSFTFVVRAIGPAGASAPSSPVTATAIAAPGKPGAPTVVAQLGALAVTVVAPTTGGTPASYVATASPGGATCTVTGATGSCTISGLSASQAYTVTTVATNDGGSSPASDPSASRTPLAVPGAPTGVTAVAGNAQAIVAWTAPSIVGSSAITGYKVQRSTNGTSWTTATTTGAAARTFTVTGLTNNTAYQFRVIAVNAAGDSAASNVANATPRAVPGAPTGVRATPGNRQVTVAWTAPSSTGGSAITGYKVQRSTNGISWTNVSTRPATARSYAVTNLTNGTAYQFRVLAVNAAGDSLPSTVANATPRTVPGAPTGVTATRGNRQVALVWNAPASTGGSAITGYKVQRSTNGTSWTTVSTRPATARSFTVTGLTNGTAYQFRIRAVNAAGDGAASAVVRATPR